MNAADIIGIDQRKHSIKKKKKFNVDHLSTESVILFCFNNCQ